MSVWVGMPPGMPVTVASPPEPGVSVGPGPVDAVVVPADWMHIVPDFSAARFAAAVTLEAVTGVEALPGFVGDVVLGATITTYAELVAAATAVATATGYIAVPIPAGATCAGTLGAATSTATDAMFSADGQFTAAMFAAGLIPADFGTTGTLAAAVDKAGFAAAFTGVATLSALVAQGDRTVAEYSATGTLAAQVLVLFVRDATYTALAELSAAQAVEPRDGASVDASLTAATRAVAFTTAALSTTALLAVAVDDYQLNWVNTRVDKTATQTLPASSWTAITWNTSTGDPVSAGTITISGGGAATITGSVAHAGAAFTNRHTFRITRNGTMVGSTWQPANYATSTAIPPLSVTLAPGDKIRLEALPASPQTLEREVNAGTFMTITAG